MILSQMKKEAEFFTKKKMYELSIEEKAKIAERRMEMAILRYKIFMEYNRLLRSRAEVARQPHKLKVGGSIPPSATKFR